MGGRFGALPLLASQVRAYQIGNSRHMRLGQIVSRTCNHMQFRSRQQLAEPFPDRDRADRIAIAPQQKARRLDRFDLFGEVDAWGTYPPSR